MSIIPGIEARAPERTDTVRGFFGSPNFRPSAFSTAARCSATSSRKPLG